MWQVTACSVGASQVQAALALNGWEPFAVDHGIMYFRRLGVDSPSAIVERKEDE